MLFKQIRENIKLFVAHTRFRSLICLNISVHGSPVSRRISIHVLLWLLTRTQIASWLSKVHPSQHLIVIRSTASQSRGQTLSNNDIMYADYGWYLWKGLASLAPYMASVYTFRDISIGNLHQTVACIPQRIKMLCIGLYFWCNMSHACSDLVRCDLIRFIWVADVACRTLVLPDISRNTCTNVHVNAIITWQDNLLVIA